MWEEGRRDEMCDSMGGVAIPNTPDVENWSRPNIFTYLFKLRSGRDPFSTSGLPRQGKKRALSSLMMMMHDFGKPNRGSGSQPQCRTMFLIKLGTCRNAVGLNSEVPHRVFSLNTH
jgi:hypothetical protein